MKENEAEEIQISNLGDPDAPLDTFDFADSAETISIEINAIARRNGSISNILVTHVFNTPTAKQIDHYRRLLSKVRGRSVKTDYTGASNYLWGQCIIDTKKYSNLPENWREYFLTNPKAQIHVQAAIDGLIEVVVPDAEMVKN